MSNVEKIRQGLGIAKSNLSAGKELAQIGKDHTEKTGSLDQAKATTDDMAKRIIEKLFDVKDDLRRLSSLADQGQDLARTVSRVNGIAVESFNAAQSRANTASSFLCPILGTAEPPQYVKDAVEDISTAERMAHELVFEGAIANGVFSKFGERSEGLHNSLGQVILALQDFSSELNDKSLMSSMEGPEENRNPEFVAGKANEAITALGAGIADVDQRLGEL